MKNYFLILAIAAVMLAACGQAAPSVQKPTATGTAAPVAVASAMKREGLEEIFEVINTLPQEYSGISDPLKGCFWANAQEEGTVIFFTPPIKPEVRCAIVPLEEKPTNSVGRIMALVIGDSWGAWVDTHDTLILPSKTWKADPKFAASILMHEGVHILQSGCENSDLQCRAKSEMEAYLLQFEVISHLGGEKYSLWLSREVQKASLHSGETLPPTKLDLSGVGFPNPEPYRSVVWLNVQYAVLGEAGFLNLLEFLMEKGEL